MKTFFSIVSFVAFAISMNAQVDVWKFSDSQKKNHTVLVLGNMSSADTITLKVGGVTIFNNLNISNIDTFYFKGCVNRHPLYYAEDLDGIPHFFERDINGNYEIVYLIWFRNLHKINKICNMLRPSEKYKKFSKNDNCGSYEVEICLNGDEYTSVGHWDKRFCYLYFFSQNGRRSVRINHDTHFKGLM